MPVFRVPGVAAAWEPYSFFLNPSSIDPTTRDDGGSLQAGMWYYNTASSMLRIYSGSTWSAFTVSGGAVSSALTLPDGTAAAPSLTFTNDVDSGFYRIGANNVGWAVNGAKVVDVASTGVGVTGTLSSTGLMTADSLSVTNLATALANFRVNDGSAGTPSISFTSDTNTGIYSVGADAIGISAGGTVRLIQDTTRLYESGNVYVGTDASAGSIAETKAVVAGVFRQLNGVTASTATATPVTIFTIPSQAGTYGTWIVTCALAGSNDVGNYHSVSLVTCNGASSINVAAMKAGTLLVIGNSGMNIQATQSSGISSVISYSAIRIA